MRLAYNPSPGWIQYPGCTTLRGLLEAIAKTRPEDLAKKIEEELEYPGILKVVVIREKRSVAYAK